MKLEYNLSVKQTQKLAMTPKMIQEIQLLQYNVQELDLYVQEQMLTNPVLEVQEKLEGDKVAETFSLEEAYRIQGNVNRENSNFSYGSSSKDDDDETSELDYYRNEDTSIQEHLKFQFMIWAKTKQIADIGDYIIESLDENGYMTSTIDEIATILGEPTEKVKHVTCLIRTLDPAGVCAVDLRDCLLLQIKRREDIDEVVEKVVKNHLEDIGENRIQYIAKEMGITSKRVEEIRNVIKTLDPKPGSFFAREEKIKYISPDVVVTHTKDGLKKEYKDGRVPTLMISSYYKNLLKEAKEDKELEEYLTDKVNGAMWLIKCIEKRQHTIANVVDAITEFQSEFFERGEMYLKPLTLKIVADHIGIHESTVSRTVSGKYMQYDRGIYELKYFFSSGIGSQSGENISSTSIKQSIKKIIEGENTKKPLSDQAIAEMLNDEGVEISRRTVAKYRESLNILSSSKRRRF